MSFRYYRITQAAIGAGLSDLLLESAPHYAYNIWVCCECLQDPCDWPVLTSLFHSIHCARM